MKVKLSSMYKAASSFCSAGFAKFKGLFSKKKTGDYAKASKVKASDRVGARRTLTKKAPNRRRLTEWAPIRAVLSLFDGLSDYYRSLGKHRLLYALTACLLLVMTPFSVAFCIPLIPLLRERIKLCISIVPEFSLPQRSKPPNRPKFIQLSLDLSMTWSFRCRKD